MAKQVKTTESELLEVCSEVATQNQPKLRYTPDEAYAIGTEIMSQLTRDWKNPYGHLRLMIGARQIWHTEIDNCIVACVKFAKFPGCKGNYLTIRLDYSDTYTVTLHNIRGTSCKAVKTQSGLFCEDLFPWFEANTGLVLGIPKIRGINC